MKRKRGNDINLIEQKARRGELRLRRGEVTILTITHDDDCAHWRGGPCDCKPEIRQSAPLDKPARTG